MARSNVVNLIIENEILTRSRALGNSNKGLKEVCSDLINNYGTTYKARQFIAAGTFLSEPTIKRMAELKDTETGEPYRPNADTIERILRFFGAEVRFEAVNISAKYQNQPKAQ